LDDQGRDSGGHISELFSDDDAVDEFFTPRVRRVPEPPPAPPPPEPRAPRPDHYKVISISLYNEDIERLDQLVKDLKARGHSRASRSMLIREALRQIDLESVPPQR
jgi:hypothetical protein